MDKRILCMLKFFDQERGQNFYRFAYFMNIDSFLAYLRVRKEFTLLDIELIDNRPILDRMDVDQLRAVRLYAEARFAEATGIENFRQPVQRLGSE